MANKRINELALRTPQTTDLMLIGDPTTGYSYKTTLLSALNLGVPTTRTITINGTTFDLSANRSWSVGTVTSVGLTMPSAFNVASSPVTGSGTIAVTAAGLASQYIRGDGTLADFPGGGGSGGASVSYYLNGSVNQGTLGGVTYYEMNKTPILGAGTNFTTSSNGYIASFITDPGDPALLKIPGGNWNTEFYFAASSGGGTPTYYIELYKYDGTTFTLIASSSSNPDAITGGTSVEQYFTTLAVPETVLTATDRLAIRIYVTTAGRTITLHTENSNLCQIITTFTTGLTALNGLTAQVQYFATGSAGTDFNISSSTATHTFNIPTASATNRGLLSTADWTTFNNKVPYTGATANVDLGIYNLSAKSVFIEGTASYQSGLAMKQLNSFDFVSGEYTQIAPSSTTELNLVYNQSGGARRRAALSAAVLQNGDNFQYLFPRQNGTFAMLTDISTAINGTTNWIPRFTSANTIGLSNLYDGSSFIGVFTATDNLSGAKLQVNGAATFSSSVTANSAILNSSGEDGSLGAVLRVSSTSTNTNARNWAIVNTWDNFGDLTFRVSTAQGGNALSAGSNVLTLLRTGAATFSSSVTATGLFGYILRGRASDNYGAFGFYSNDGATRYGYIQSHSTNGGQLNITADGGAQLIMDSRGSIFNTGNLGLGVTPSAWNSGYKVMDISAWGSIAGEFGTQGTISLVSNCFANSTGYNNWTYVNTAPATRYKQYNGEHQFFTAPSGTAGNAITFTQAMTLNASGNLGLGVTPNTWTGTGVKAFQFQNGSLAASNTFGTILSFNAYYDSGWKYVSSSVTTGVYQIDGNSHIWQVAPSGTAGNAITFTQAMTLDASGRLMIGLTSALTRGGAAGVSINASFASALSIGLSDNDIMYVRRGGATAVYQFQTNDTGANTGQIHLQPYGGRVLLGTTTDNTVDLLQVAGSVILSTGGSNSNLKFLNNASGSSRSISYRVATAEITINDTGGNSLVKFGNGGKVSFLSLPTSSAGLSAGDLWNDGGTVKIV